MPRSRRREGQFSGKPVGASAWCEKCGWRRYSERESSPEFSSFDYSRHFEVPGTARGCIRNGVFIFKRNIGDIFAQSCDFIFVEEDLRHRLAIGCIKLVELLNMRQDLAEVVGHPADFFVCEPQINEISNVANFFIG